MIMYIYTHFFDTRTPVLLKVSKFLRQKNVSTWNDVLQILETFDFYITEGLLLGVGIFEYIYIYIWLLIVWQLRCQPIKGWI